MTYQKKDRVLIIGGGFGGLAAARAFKGQNVDVTLVDRQNHHLFQPLLYQVATGALNATEIAAPLRHLLRKQENVRVLMQEVTGIDKAAKAVVFADGNRAYYDHLIVAAGSRYNYFGKTEWEKDAPSLKSVEDALDIRRRILTAFEKAENDPEHAHEWLNFVIIGGGPTGVELAGQIAELARKGMQGNFRHIDPTQARVILLDVADKVLTPMGENLSQKGTKQLAELGVEMYLGKMVTDIDDQSVTFGDETIATRTVIWAAGVQAGSLAGIICDQAEIAPGPGGRLVTDEFCLIEGLDNAYAVGDICAIRDCALPGLATVAMQQGRYVARHITGKTDEGFAYKDKGTLATIGRNRAVGRVGRFEMAGFIAWVLWLTIHLRYLAGLQNRMIVLTRWIVSYFTFNRSGRLITREHVEEKVHTVT